MSHPPQTQMDGMRSSALVPQVRRQQAGGFGARTGGKFTAGRSHPSLAQVPPESSNNDFPLNTTRGGLRKRSTVVVVTPVADKDAAPQIEELPRDETKVEGNSRPYPVQPQMGQTTNDSRNDKAYGSNQPKTTNDLRHDNAYHSNQAQVTNDPRHDNAHRSNQPRNALGAPRQELLPCHYQQASPAQLSLDDDNFQSYEEEFEHPHPHQPQSGHNTPMDGMDYNGEEGDYYPMDGGDGYEADEQIPAAMPEWQEPRNITTFDSNSMSAMARRMSDMSNKGPRSDSSDTGILFHMGGVAPGRQTMATFGRGRDGFHRQNEGGQMSNHNTSYGQATSELPITARRTLCQPLSRAPPAHQHSGPAPRRPLSGRAAREMHRSVQENQPAPMPALFSGKEFSGIRGPLQSLNLQGLWKEALSAVKAKHAGKLIEVDYILNELEVYGANSTKLIADMQEVVQNVTGEQEQLKSTVDTSVAKLRRKTVHYDKVRDLTHIRSLQAAPWQEKRARQ